MHQSEGSRFHGNHKANEILSDSMPSIVPLANRSRLVDGLAGARLSTRRSNNGTAILLVYSDTQSEEACNHEYYDHDADDVENIHCALRFRFVRLQCEAAVPSLKQ